MVIPIDCVGISIGAIPKLEWEIGDETLDLEFIPPWEVSEQPFDLVIDHGNKTIVCVRNGRLLRPLKGFVSTQEDFKGRRKAY